MMKQMKKRALALLLALSILASLAPAALAAQPEQALAEETQTEQTQAHRPGFALQDGQSSVGGLRLPDQGGAASTPGTGADGLAISGTLTEGTGEVTEAGLESGEDRPAHTGANSEPEAGDQVTFIVELEHPSLLAQGYSAGEIADNTSGVQSYEARQEAALDELKEQILETVGGWGQGRVRLYLHRGHHGPVRHYQLREQGADRPATRSGPGLCGSHVPHSRDG